MYCPCSIKSWIFHIVESNWNLVNLCSLTFQRCEKDLGIPRRSWLTDGKSAVVAGPEGPHGRASGQKPTKELCTREAYDESQSTAGQK